MKTNGLKGSPQRKSKKNIMSDLYRHKIEQELSIPAKADPKYKDGKRVIADRFADISFDGYEIKEDKTVLINPVLISGCLAFPEQAFEIAEEILKEWFEDIGTECVEQP